MAREGVSVAEFPAKYSTGQCPNGDPILEGQMVVYIDQELWHTECVDKSGTSSPGGAEQPGKWDGTTQENMGY
jgi:hypothetical protein